MANVVDLVVDESYAVNFIVYAGFFRNGENEAWQETYTAARDQKRHVKVESFTPITFLRVEKINSVDYYIFQAVGREVALSEETLKHFQLAIVFS